MQPFIYTCICCSGIACDAMNPHNLIEIQLCKRPCSINVCSAIIRPPDGGPILDTRRPYNQDNQRIMQNGRSGPKPDIAGPYVKQVNAIQYTLHEQLKLKKCGFAAHQHKHRNCLELVMFVIHNPYHVLQYYFPPSLTTGRSGLRTRWHSFGLTEKKQSFLCH